MDLSAFGPAAKIAVDFTFAYDSYKINTDTFSLSAEDVLSENFCLFRKEDTLGMSSDLMLLFMEIFMKEILIKSFYFQPKI